MLVRVDALELGFGDRQSNNIVGLACFPFSDCLIADCDVGNELADPECGSADADASAEHLRVGDPAPDFDMGQLVNEGDRGAFGHGSFSFRKCFEQLTLIDSGSRFEKPLIEIISSRPVNVDFVPHPVAA